MKKESSTTTGEARLKHLFDSCKQDLFNDDLPTVRQRLKSTLSSFSIPHRLAVAQALRRACKAVGVSTRIIGIGDVERIVLGASLWAYNVEEYAMSMGSRRSFREKIWQEVEEISQLTKDDVYKLSSHLKGNLRDWN